MASIGEELYAGIGGLGIYKTKDGGETWVSLSKGITSLSPVAIIAKDSFLFTGTLFAGIFRSNNGGETWEAFNNGLKEQDVYSLSLKENRLLAGTGIGIFYSDDNGEHWIQAQMPIQSAPNKIIFSLLVLDDKIVAGSSENIFISYDNGETWKEVITGNQFDVKVLETRSDKIYLGSSGDGIKISELRDGETWFSDENLILNEQNKNINDLIFIDTVIIRASDIAGITKVDSPFNEGFNRLEIKCLAFHDKYLYAGTLQDGIWKYDITTTPLHLETNSLVSLGIYPNPSSSIVEVNYEVQQEAMVEIKLYHSSGIKIITIVNNQQNKGHYNTSFDVTHLQNGTYYCTFKIGNQFTVKSLIIVK